MGFQVEFLAFELTLMTASKVFELDPMNGTTVVDDDIGSPYPVPGRRHLEPDLAVRKM